MYKKHTFADIHYARLLETLLSDRAAIVSTRNSKVSRVCIPESFRFNSFPLVTARKTAVKMALNEWEWFMSGKPQCPANLLPWWEKQLNEDGEYHCGYSEQMRSQNSCVTHSFDQYAYLFDSLKNHPLSRRHVISLWNTGDMSQITTLNSNTQTPSTCHSSLIQFFVEPTTYPTLHMYSYQRSSDCILGLPHNWVQSWSFLVFMAHHCNYDVGSMTYQLGDAHLYHADGHLEAANEISYGLSIADYYTSSVTPQLNYKYSGEPDLINPSLPRYVASDFSISGEVPDPFCKIKPKLVD